MAGSRSDRKPLFGTRSKVGFTGSRFANVGAAKEAELVSSVCGDSIKSFASFGRGGSKLAFPTEGAFGRSWELFDNPAEPVNGAGNELFPRNKGGSLEV